MLRAILDTRAVGSTALAYSIPPPTFHASTLFKHGGKSLNGWYGVRSVTMCPYAFCERKQAKLCYSGSFVAESQGCLEQTSRNRHVTFIQ
jgi:hypothetical protein